MTDPRLPDRLQQQHERLYLPTAGPDGQVRALVLAASGASAWPALSQCWRGVQADLGLPAPAIAISGDYACQLWFGLERPVPAVRAQAFLQALAARWLAEVPLARRKAWPDAHAASAPPGLPPQQLGPERWSAFVAPDLAALFADAPWLDHPPGVDAQADLLARVVPVAPAAFDAACSALGLDGKRPSAPAPQAPAAPATAQEDDAAQAATAFLLSVVRDPAADLALRIDAAKALLARR